MASEPPYDIFRDPIHGFIKVYGVEKDVINSKPFQRLRRIRQLGLTSLVYHGAEHTRFGHSIGVMNFASKVLDSLWARYRPLFKKRLNWNDSKYKVARNKLRLAALLHDVGHAPFSHAADLFPNTAGKKESHETYGEKIVDQTEISQIIDRHSKDTDVDKTDVLNLMNKNTLGLENILLRNVFVGDLDADRMDYLLRDSLYTGVQYGRFDSDRLIEKLGLLERNDGSLVIAVEESGMHAAEGLLLARYFMFTQVYFHQIRRIYDIHLTRVIQEALNELTGCREFPKDVEKYLNIDDHTIFSFIEKKAKEGKLEEATFIQNRTRYRLAEQTGEYAYGEEVDKFEKLSNRLSDKLGQEFVIKDKSIKAHYNYDYKKGEERLLVMLKNKQTRDIAFMSKVIENLYEICQYRVYVHPNHYDTAESLVDNWNKRK